MERALARPMIRIGRLLASFRREGRDGGRKETAIVVQVPLPVQTSTSSPRPRGKVTSRPLARRCTFYMKRIIDLPFPNLVDTGRFTVCDGAMAASEWPMDSDESSRHSPEFWQQDSEHGDRNRASQQSLRDSNPLSDDPTKKCSRCGTRCPHRAVRTIHTTPKSVGRQCLSKCHRRDIPQSHCYAKNCD